MDARMLYEDGVEAIRSHDLETGRRLLLQSLRIAPDNDMAWLWLSRALSSPDRQAEALRRALAINPDNRKAQDTLARLQAQTTTPHTEPHHDPTPPTRRTSTLLVVPKTTTTTMAAVQTGAADPHCQEQPGIPTPDSRQQDQIAALLKKAVAFSAAGDSSGMLQQYVRVLKIQPDHSVAMREAVRLLVKTNAREDARRLVWHALDQGTVNPSIFLTAIDFARLDNNPAQVDDLRRRLIALPTTDDELVKKLAGDYIREGERDKAEALLRAAVDHHPYNQPLLMALGDYLEQAGRRSDAVRFYDRAAKLGVGTKVGKEADKRLANYAPVLTDRERGSLLLALREAVAFPAFYLLLAWQDAGLNLFRLDFAHVLGIALSFVGGYLLVTATSSPQQARLTRLLGGETPAVSPLDELGEARRGQAVQEPSRLLILPELVRWGLGMVGVLVLLIAFWLVFSSSIQLLFDPISPLIPDPFTDF